MKILKLLMVMSLISSCGTPRSALPNQEAAKVRCEQLAETVIIADETDTDERKRESVASLNNYAAVCGDFPIEI